MKRETGLPKKREQRIKESCLRRHFTQFFTPIFQTFQKERARKSLDIKDLRTLDLGGTTQI